MKKVKVGVVGVGYLGQHHARIYSELPEIELIGVVDTDIHKAQSVSKKTGSNPFTQYSDLFGLVEAVSIAVPTTLHYKVAADFLNQGIDVLLEKPITETVSEADELIKLANKNKLILQVGHLERFNTAFREVEKIVNKPKFIETHRLGPFVGRGIDVDIILDLMIHDLDIILHLVKSEVKQINAVGIPVITSNIDIANVRIQFENGCVANITASRVSNEKMRKIRIFQPDAYISLDYASQEVKAFKRVLPSNAQGDDIFPQIIEEKIKVTKEEPLKMELMEFIKATRTRKISSANAQEGREALKLASEILEKITIPA